MRSGTNRRTAPLHAVLSSPLFFGTSVPCSQTPSACVLTLMWQTKYDTHTKNGPNYSAIYKGRSKGLPITGHEGPEGEQMYSSTITSTLALDGGGWSTSRPRRFTPGKDPVPIVQEAGWAPGPVWTGSENLVPAGIRSPDRPARSESLYRLSYPGPLRLPKYLFYF